MPVWAESAIEMSIAAVSLGVGLAALAGVAGGWRPLLSGRAGPWFAGALAALGLGLWQAHRIDQAKAGALGAETLAPSRFWLAIGMATFSVLVVVAVLQVRSASREAPSRGLGG